MAKKQIGGIDFVGGLKYFIGYCKCGKKILKSREELEEICQKVRVVRQYLRLFAKNDRLAIVFKRYIKK